jgi:hypothetical protein
VGWPTFRYWLSIGHALADALGYIGCPSSMRWLTFCIYWLSIRHGLANAPQYWPPIRHGLADPLHIFSAHQAWVGRPIGIYSLPIRHGLANPLLYIGCQSGMGWPTVYIWTFVNIQDSHNIYCVLNKHMLGCYSQLRYLSAKHMALISSIPSSFHILPVVSYISAIYHMFNHPQLTTS